MDIVGKIPEFTQDSIEPGTEEVKEPAGTDTPAELPAASDSQTEAEQKPALEETQSEDTGNEEIATLLSAKQGLEAERAKLLKEISELKGTRREIKQDALIKVQTEIDELKDVNPQDVELIEKVIKSKGYVKKDEVKLELYEEVKNQELAKFLDLHPEYKPENDPNDLKWSALQREFSEFARPNDPHRIGYLLEKANKTVNPQTSERSITTAVKRQQIKTAGLGAGGTQRSSTKITDPRLAELMATYLHGYTEEEKKQMLSNYQ